MGQVLHGSATTTEAIRRAIQNSQLKRRRKPTDKWHLDEVFVVINGNRYYLWLAVGSEGMVLDILMQTRRNAKAAKRFFKHALHTTSARP